MLYGSLHLLASLDMEPPTIETPNPKHLLEAFNINR
jgi:hypothetical protein